MNNNNDKKFNKEENTNKIVPALKPKIRDDELYGYDFYDTDKVESNHPKIVKNPPPTTPYEKKMITLNVFVNYENWPRAK